LIDDLGHRAIAAVWGGTAKHEDNLAGYRRALATARIPFRPELVVANNGGRDAGAGAAAALLRRGTPFTAVYVDTDLKAIGLIEHLRAHGIRVPEDISVLGADDIPGVSEDFGLTTMRRPFFETGQALYELLEARVRAGGADVASRLVCGVLVCRGTCARPRAG
jgi:LacI family transcriptional regulator